MGCMHTWNAQVQQKLKQQHMHPYTRTARVRLCAYTKRSNQSERMEDRE